MARNLIIFDLQGTLVKGMRPPVLNGSLKTIEKLAYKNTLAIFTGASKSETINILKSLKIYSFFKPKNIINKNQFQPKPNPGAIRWIIVNNNIDKTYYIGDTRKDWQCAQNSQVKFIYMGKQNIGITQINSLDELLNVKINL
jgi:phosphoglycolate phosphatase-like HAD superfamily hydrolase